MNPQRRIIDPDGSGVSADFLHGFMTEVWAIARK